MPHPDPRRMHVWREVERYLGARGEARPASSQDKKKTTVATIDYPLHDLVVRFHHDDPSFLPQMVEAYPEATRKLNNHDGTPLYQRIPYEQVVLLSR
jgi:hypothetical protein